MSVPSTPTSPPPEPYEIKAVTQNDTEPILEHLRKSFFRDEPLNINVNLIESEDSTCVELEQFSIDSINEGISIMAVTSSGKIVGVCLNGILRRDSPKEENEECPNPKFAKILNFLDTLDKQGDVFGKFPDVDNVLTVKILSVDGACRGRGLAKQLMDRTRNIAQEQGCGLMRVDCTSHFSARAIARLGFDCIYTLKYEDYTENGKPVFNPEDPHKDSKIYVQKLSPL